MSVFVARRVQFMSSGLLNFGRSSRNICTSSDLFSFWEPDRKSGYNTKKDLPIKRHIKEGLKQLPEELSKFKEETKVKFRCDSAAIQLQHGDYEVLWKFDNAETVKSWIVTSDRDHHEGQSSSEFVLGANKRGIFRGRLDTTVPKDGITKCTGYCNIQSPSNMISFKRVRPYNLEMFNHLVMRVRGDGRSYQIVLNMDRRYDLQWNDQYAYALFTRGGPYWQTSKIPFSKFYLNSKGRIQDKQEEIQLDRIKSVGITIADDEPGPFNLEIDYIAAVYDSTHHKTFEYEMYPVSITAFS